MEHNHNRPVTTYPRVFGGHRIAHVACKRAHVTRHCILEPITTSTESTTAIVVLLVGNGNTVENAAARLSQDLHSVYAHDVRRPPPDVGVYVVCVDLMIPPQVNVGEVIARHAALLSPLQSAASSATVSAMAGDELARWARCGAHMDEVAAQITTHLREIACTTVRCIAAGHTLGARFVCELLCRRAILHLPRGSPSPEIDLVVSHIHFANAAPGWVMWTPLQRRIAEEAAATTATSSDGGNMVEQQLPIPHATGMVTQIVCPATRILFTSHMRVTHTADMRDVTASSAAMQGGGGGGVAAAVVDVFPAPVENYAQDFRATAAPVAEAEALATPESSPTWFAPVVGAVLAEGSQMQFHRALLHH